MPLGAPPSRATLRRLPSRRIAGATLHRVHRAGRPLWWFSTVDPSDLAASGRFDLPAPNGACYLATTRSTAVLEALQRDFSGGSLPVSALRRRSVSAVVVPPGSAPAAGLTSRAAVAAGVTVALWADRDRALTQRWAVELHGAGWPALYHGAQHDPTGRGRAVTLFDRAGSDPAWGAEWPEPAVGPLDDPGVRQILARHDVQVSDTLAPDLEVLDAARSVGDEPTGEEPS